MNVASGHFEAVREALAKLDAREIDLIADAVSRATERGAPVLCCGNGGSAATAIHFASDLRSVGVQAWDMLSPSKTTQLTNDVGPGSVFAAQCLQDALVVAFSGSGTSANIERLFYVDNIDLIVVTSTMKEGKRIWDRCEVPRATFVVIQSDDYEVIEDAHLAICHAVKKVLRERLSV